MKVATNELPRRVCTGLRFLIAEQADECVTWLKVNGFEVLSVEAGPRIIVRPSPLCDAFEGAVEAYSRGIYGVQRYKMVVRFKCAVCWLDEGGVQ